MTVPSQPPEADAADVRIEAVDVEVILPVRAAVLRAGLPVDLARFEQDGDPATVHLAALDPSGQVIGCSSWSPDVWDGRPAWRLRGMATVPSERGRGVGARLLAAGLALGVDAGIPVAWCNARTSALGFYRRYGFTAVGEEFVTQYAGPHYRMWRPLP